MTSVTTVEVEPQQESVASKQMCPLKNPVMLDVFTEIISDSSGQDIPYILISLDFDATTTVKTVLENLNLLEHDNVISHGNKEIPLKNCLVVS